MKRLPEAKSARLLTIYSRLVNGETLSRPQLALEYNVSTRSIQRDFESLRCFLVERGLPQEITYGKKQGGYRLVSAQPQGLTDEEMVAVGTILMESGAMPEDELRRILDKLIGCAVVEANQAGIRERLGEAAGKRCD